MKTKFQVFTERLLFFGGILMIVATPIALANGYIDLSTAWVSAVCGSVVLLASKFDDLAEFSLGPLRAKVQEKLNEAVATLDQLKGVALTSTYVNLTDVIAGEFALGNMSLSWKLDIHKKMVEALREIGATESEIESVEAEWKKGISVIYTRIIRRHVEERTNPHKVNPNTPPNQKDASQEIKNTWDFSTWTMPTPNQIQAILDRHKVDLLVVNQWLDDYRHFEKTGEIRREEEFSAQ